MPKLWKITEPRASFSISCLYDSQKLVKIKIWQIIFYFFKKKNFKESYRILDFGTSLLVKESDTRDLVKEYKRENEKGDEREGQGECLKKGAQKGKKRENR